MRVIGYIRVSTEEQADSGAGLEAQRAAIVSECARRGWELTAVVEDAGFSAKDLRRPGIREALLVLEAGGAEGLVVSKLDRLSRSTLDFTMVMETARKRGWALVSLDCAVDTSSPAGEAMANVMATFAQLERRLIGQRTKDALAVRRAAGVRLGRPPGISVALRARIRGDLGSGLSLGAIARCLNEEGVPTVQGGRCWYRSTVRAAARVSV